MAGSTHAKPEHRVDLHRHAVARDRFLLLHGDRDGAGVDLPLPFDERDQVVEARPAHADEPAEAKDDAALVLLRDANPREQEKHDSNESNERRREWSRA